MKKCFMTFFFKTSPPPFAILPEMSEHKERDKGTNSTTTAEMSFSVKGKNRQ